MHFMAPFVATLLPMTLVVSISGHSYGTDGFVPAGWNAEVENFCSTPESLLCCNDTTLAGVAGEPTST